jgi:hypothetical protein
VSRRESTCPVDCRSCQPWKTAEVSDNRPTEALTARTAQAALSSACSIAGIDTLGATLLGPVADNAVCRLPGKLVARVTLRSAARRARREVLAGRWLADQGVQAVRPVETIDQPLLVDGHVVTLWYEVTGGVMASTAEFGKLLRQLHELSPPSDFELWRWSRSSGLTNTSRTQPNINLSTRRTSS